MLQAKKTNLPEDFLNMDYLHGRVHSIFEQVINLEFVMNLGVQKEHRLITLLLSDTIMVPDSIVVPIPFFLLVKNYKECGIIKEKKMLHFGGSNNGLNLAGTGNQSLSFESSRLYAKRSRMLQFLKHVNGFRASCGKTDGFGIIPSIYISVLEAFVDSLLTENFEEASSSYYRLIGVGHGLTPTCDDAMVGALACICGLYAAIDPINGILKLKEFVGPLIPFTKSQTTDVSSKYLKCALRGSFSEVLYRLVLWLYREEQGDINKILGQFTLIGHTSGIDMLRGFETAVSRVLRKDK